MKMSKYYEDNFHSSEHQMKDSSKKVKMLSISLGILDSYDLIYFDDGSRNFKTI